MAWLIVRVSIWGRRSEQQSVRARGFLLTFIYSFAKMEKRQIGRFVACRFLSHARGLLLCLWAICALPGHGYADEFLEYPGKCQPRNISSPIRTFVRVEDVAAIKNIDPFIGKLRKELENIQIQIRGRRNKVPLQMQGPYGDDQAAQLLEQGPDTKLLIDLTAFPLKVPQKEALAGSNLPLTLSEVQRSFHYLDEIRSINRAPFLGGRYFSAEAKFRCANFFNGAIKEESIECGMSTYNLQDVQGVEETKLIILHIGITKMVDELLLENEIEAMRFIGDPQLVAEKAAWCVTAWLPNYLWNISVLYEQGG
jgi:hypothetical protein